jgi:spore maturation protein CgeB
MSQAYDIVILGLSITSSWGNGHATTWRALIKGLSTQGKRVLFLERDQAWYAAHRDLHNFPYCDVRLYTDVEDLRKHHTAAIANANAVIIGSYVPDGIRISQWVLQAAQGACAFYDIDTPVTLANVKRGECAYLTAALIPRFDVYLSFTAGPVLEQLTKQYGAQRAVALYCSVDVDEYRPLSQTPDTDLGYMGTYSPDRQPKLQQLLLDVATQLPTQRFVVAGAQYPGDVIWPGNVERIEHLPPAKHRSFYCGQRFTLNLTRSDMVASGYSPSVRLFEAAACGVPIISDVWPGLEQLFTPGEEILLASNSNEVIEILLNVSDKQRKQIADAAFDRVMKEHSGVCRAGELERYLADARAPIQPVVSLA